MLNYGCDHCGKIKKNQRQHYWLKDSNRQKVTVAVGPLYLNNIEIQLPIPMRPAYSKPNPGSFITSCLSCWNNTTGSPSKEYREVATKSILQFKWYSIVLQELNARQCMNATAQLEGMSTRSNENILKHVNDFLIRSHSYIFAFFSLTLYIIS